MIVAASSSADATAAWNYYEIGLPGVVGGSAQDPAVGQDANAIAVTSDIYDAADGYTQSVAFTLAKSQVLPEWSRRAARSSRSRSTPRRPPHDQARPQGIRNARLFRPTSAPQSGEAPDHETTGAFTSAPSQLDGRVWFAHTVAAHEFDIVEYGYLNPNTMNTHTGSAYHSDSSFDFAPSIVATRYPGSTLPHAVLNWTHTDPSADIAPTAVSASVTGYKLADKSGTAYTSAVTTSADGNYSPTAIAADYGSVGTCPAGAYAAVAAQYFAPDHTWRTRVALVGPSC